MDIAPDTPTAQAFHYTCTACQVNVAMREAMLHHAQHVHSPHSLAELIGAGVITQVEHTTCLGCQKVFLDKRQSHRHRSQCQGLAIEFVEKDPNQNVAAVRSSGNRLNCFLTKETANVNLSTAEIQMEPDEPTLEQMQAVFGERVCNELTRNSKEYILDILMRLKNNTEKLHVFECFPENIPWNYWLIIKRVEHEAGRLTAKDPTGHWHNTSGQKYYASGNKSTGYVHLYADPSDDQTRNGYPSQLYTAKFAKSKKQVSEKAYANSFCYKLCQYRRHLPDGTTERKKVYSIYYPDGSKGEHIYVIFQSSSSKTKSVKMDRHLNKIEMKYSL